MEKEYTKAVIYCRVSSEKQVKEGNGLDSQEHRCREYANSLGLEVECVFRDEGISGGLFDRPAMLSLLGYLDSHWQNKYMVIFDDLKRFARDVEVHLRLKSEFAGRQAKLRCLNYNFDDSAEGEFVETIFAAQNELERKQNKRQVCQKMKARLERGYWCFRPPTGYEYQKDKEHGKLMVPNREVTDILAKGFNDFAEDRLLGQVDFLRYLVLNNFHGVLGKKKEQITFEYVKILLTQPLYAGLIEYAEWDVSKRRGHHKAIITEATFNKIQSKLIKPEGKPREIGNETFPLRQLINCAFCGRKMTSSVNKGKNKHYAHYTCNNRNCLANPKNILVDKMEADYVELLKRVEVDPALVKMADVAIARVWEERAKYIEVSQAAKEAEKKEMEEMIEEYIKLIPKAKSESVRVRYETKIEELDSSIKKLEEKPADIKNGPDFSEARNLMLRFLLNPAETWIKAGREMKIMIHKMIFEENPVYSLETGFRTPKLSLPFRIKELVENFTESLVDPTGFEPATSSVQMRRSTN